MSIREQLAARAVEQAERGHLPDSLIRLGIRRVIASRLSKEHSLPQPEREVFWKDAWSGPIAVSTDRANQQHYEVPPAFFDLVLGGRRKYSSAFWPRGTEGLEEAEEAMLELYAERAELADGQLVLDLGCGWGSFTLWAAEQYPLSRIVGVSNSHAQATYIKQAAADRGLTNVEVVTADINDYQPSLQFDRIMSIEMLEHVRNHRALFERMRNWVKSDGRVFTHVFANQTFAYPFEVDGPGTWMASTFFTGGIMPSRDLLPSAAEPHFNNDGEWWVDGTHYSLTLESWLDNLDDNASLVRGVLAPVYGSDVEKWVQRWRMFFMACSEMFSHNDGTEWGVVHQRFRPV